MRGTHINLQEIWVANVWLQWHPSVQDTCVRFDMVNVIAVRCLQVQGTAHTDPLLSLTEQILLLGAKRGITLSVRYVRGEGERLGGCPLQVQGDIGGVAPRPQGVRSPGSMLQTPGGGPLHFTDHEADSDLPLVLLEDASRRA